MTTNCSQLKMRSADGKRYNTDVADTEQLLRIIQSIPSPKAEPFKLWLAQVGRERIEETIDPELTIDRALNEARFSNIFIEKRASSCPQSLEKSRLFSYALLMSEGENSQNVKRILLRKVVIWTQFYDKLAQYASSNACGVLYFKVRWGRSSL